MRSLFVFFAALFLAACQQDSGASSSAPTGAGLVTSEAGSALPEITILSPEGDEIGLADVAEGNPMLVNLWASWCAPCVHELPTLVALSGEAEGFKVLTLSQDMGPQSSIRAFLEGKAIEGVEPWQDPEMAMTDTLGIQIMPTTILYDADGRELWRYVGDLDWSSDEAATMIADAL